jgi:AraC-like DNA-binding protein
MVCTRCIMIVQIELEKLGIQYTTVELGRVQIIDDLSPEQRERIEIALLQSGLELMDNRKNILIEGIKNVVMDIIHNSDEPLKTNFSDHLSEQLDYDYTYLANLFSEDQHTTIEQFLIHQKIKRVKELMEDSQLSLTEISWKLHYSSVAHLSTQFKKVTGVTPSYFKNFDLRLRAVNV